MTEQEMRELDTWIAEYGFGLEYDAELRSWCGRNEEGERFLIQSIAFTSGEFPRVKREIERCGWIWQAAYCLGGGHDFAIFDPDGSVVHSLDGKETEVARILAVEHAETEELAGCLAFKAAVEATDGET